MAKILVTGATGFIGRHTLAPLRATGAEIHATARRIPDDAAEDIHWHAVDLLDAAQTGELVADLKPSHLLHLAWYVEPGKFWTATENLRWVQASLSLLRFFAEAGGRRVVIGGSCTEYDWQFNHCSEELTPLAPQTLYGASKHALQVILSAYARQVGLSAAWGRIFFLFGPHEYPTRLAPSVINALLRNEPALCSHGEQLRDFMYVQDVAAALVALLNSEVTGAVNIASGEAIQLKSHIFTIADLLDRRDLVRLGALPTPPSEPLTLTANVTRLRHEVGWTPRYELKTAVAETIAWWRESTAETGRAAF